MGFDVSDEGKASFSEHQKAAQKTGPSSSNSGMGPPALPPLPSSGSKVTGKPPRPNTLFSIVSQQKKEGAASSPNPVSTTSTAKVCRKVKFDDSFESDDSDASLPKKQALQRGAEAKPAPDDVSESDSTEDAPTEVTEDDSDFEVVLRRPRPGAAGGQHRPRPPDEDDDLSMSAFVSASVRRQSILPSPQQSGQGLDTSLGSIDSFEGAPGRCPRFVHSNPASCVIAAVSQTITTLALYGICWSMSLDSI